jgi:hypothetical protein
MSDEEFDKKMVELKAHLNYVEHIIQESEENHRYGWTLRKKRVKWHMLQVKHMLCTRLKK